MSNRTPPPPAVSTSAKDRRRLTAALLSYLDEIEEAWTTCKRHDASTRAVVRGGDVELVRSYPFSLELAANVRSTVERLPDWEQSPHWAASRARWLASLRRVQRRRGRVYARGLCWEGWPLLVCVVRRRDEREAVVSLTLPSIAAPLPPLDLRRIASALDCFAVLAPQAPARAGPRSTSTERSLQRHLLRTTPEDLAARKCISASGA